MLYFCAMNQATRNFILQHQDDDVRKLAFLGSKYPDVDMPFALDQIRGRKMAHTKLPRWAEIDGIIYPPHISMEQCSSEQTALYKAELAARLLHLQEPETGELTRERTVGSEFAQNEFVDLTGGFGVDFSYIATRLGVRSMYVERQAHLCEAAKANFRLLGLGNVIVENADGVKVLHSLAKNAREDEGPTRDAQPPLKLIFIDPARRDDAGNKVVSLQDCTPDVTLLQDEMLSVADFAIIKLSPMLDWHRAVSELKHVREVHIVSVGNECKELLLVLSAKDMAGKEQKTKTSADKQEALTVYCVNDQQTFVFEENDEEKDVLRIATRSFASQNSMENGLYLYEPNASLMKAGCFATLSERYGAEMLAKNSHLFISDKAIADFPGRGFVICAISSMNKKELKRNLQGITKANIATRNFPLSVAELRKRLKLKEGGDVYIFASTLSDESHVLLVCEKEDRT